jgi:hypothetical protein
MRLMIYSDYDDDMKIKSAMVPQHANVLRGLCIIDALVYLLKTNANG